MERGSVLIYGDSLMKGTVIDEKLRYHATMQGRLQEMQQAHQLAFCNRARFGITIEKGITLLEKDLAEDVQYDYALIEFGGNDCNFRWDEVSAAPEEEHLPLTSLETFKETLAEMIGKARKAGMIPVLMTLPPIDSERYLEFVSRGGNDKGRILRWLGDAHMIYRFHELYSNAAGELARQMNTLLVDVRSKFLAQFRYRELVGLDGIHLAPAGYRLLQETFSAYIQELRKGREAIPQ